LPEKELNMDKSTLEQGTQHYWKTGMAAPLFDLCTATVIVEIYPCGCKKIHENSDLAKKSEFVECGRRHRVLPRRLHREYFV
jgi:hypothetical protein